MVAGFLLGCSNRVILEPFLLSKPLENKITADLTKEPRFLWSFDAPGEAAGGPVVFGEVVAMPTKNRSVWFLDKQSGKKLGVYDISGVPAGVIFDGRENLIVAEKSGNGQVFSYSLVDGAVNWRFDLNEGGEALTFKRRGDDQAGTVLASDLRGWVYALRADDGKQLWRLGLAPFSCPPVWTDSILWLADFEGDLNAVSDGKVVKTFKLAQTALTFESVGEALVIGGGDSSVTVISTLDGKTKWKIAADGKVRSLGVYDSVVYYASAIGTVGACRLESGQKLWERKLDVLVNQPLIANSLVVIVGSADGRLFALSTDKGEILWERKLAGALVGKPVLAGNTLYLATAGGRIFAFRY